MAMQFIISVNSVSFVFHLALKKPGIRPQMPPRDDGADGHAQKQHHGVHLACEVDHPERGCNAADEHLALRADVPEAHLERRREADGDTGQDHAVTDGEPHALAEAKRAGGEGNINLQGFILTMA